MKSKNTGSERPRCGALEKSASLFGLIVERFPMGRYWVSGLEAWRSETWVREEIARRADRKERSGDEV